MGTQHMKGRAVTIPGGLAIGGIVSMIITVLLAGVGAHLVIQEILPQEQIGYCSIFALTTAEIIGAITATVKVKRRKLIVCLLSGLVYFLMLLSMTALFFGGQYEGMEVTFLTIALASVAAALITSREGKTNKRRSYKKSGR